MDNYFKNLEERLVRMENALALILDKMNSETTTDNDEFGDIEDCSRWIKRSKNAIYSMVYQKSIPCIKRGKRLLFNKKAINDWLMSASQGTTSDVKKEIDEHLQNLKIA